MREEERVGLGLHLGVGFHQVLPQGQSYHWGLLAVSRVIGNGGGCYSHFVGGGQGCC